MFWPTHAVARMAARIGRVVPAVGIWSPCRIRGCERRRERLQLHALAYNLGNFLRTLATPEPIKEPRPLCYLPDGRGRHRTANVPRDFAAHRGATAAATTSA